ncbi:Trypsin-1 [Orchesella cincta]|uniref:Trypsin-1 n=1 Tax=Orchesella cincta TaxID=48709 RepID=A0A1D2MHF0_ORCCI|nr:Trypsin-1 [Orchesella cincta]
MSVHLKMFLRLSFSGCMCLVLTMAASSEALQNVHGRPSLKIVGGVNTTDAEFPYLVSIQMNPDFGNRYHYCGGSILNASHVISTASCVEGRLVSQIQVVAGAHTLQTALADDPRIQRRNIASVTLHPQFDPETLQNNIALLSLSESLQLNSRIQPILISQEGKYVGNCTVVGWGSNLTPDGPSPEPQFLLKQNMTIVSLSTCQSSYEFIYDIVETMICAKGTTEEKTEGPCTGDSGSPLLCTDASNNATVVAGIFSWSMIPCGDASYPSVYTNITTLTTINSV